MKKSEINRICATCSHVSFLFPGDRCYCDLKGPVDESGTCRQFTFDVLRHKPSAPVLLDIDTEESR